MGASAGLLSFPTGWVFAQVLVYVIKLRTFGWTIQLAVYPWVFVQALGVSIAAALLAAIYPMRRLLGAPVASALRGE
jgi:putative ABC transport system permease protein